MSQATTPRTAAAYFGDAAPHPTIEQTYIAGKGWKRYPGCKRISTSWARKLQRSGVVAVALRSGTRVADFQIGELV